MREQREGTLEGAQTWACPALPRRETNLYKWNCHIPGKENTLWEGGFYPLTMEFTEDYPAKPPKVLGRPHDRGAQALASPALHAMPWQGRALAPGPAAVARQSRAACLPQTLHPPLSHCSASCPRAFSIQTSTPAAPCAYPF